METPSDLSLHAMAARLRDGSLTSVALAERAIARHARYGAALNAYKLWQPERALEVARGADAARAAGADLGPLQGIPVSIKDLFALDRTPIFAGSPRRLPERYEREGPVVRALTRALAVPMGKTHTTEFGFGMHGRNFHWGTPRNPWDAREHRVPCGSSSGAGISLIEGSAHLALGSDSGGSVRLPASMTGTVGLKTTHGRWPLDGIARTCISFDSPGVLARTVTDTALGFAAIEAGLAGRADPPPPRQRDLAGTRLGILDDFFWAECSPGVAEGCEDALVELERRGARALPFDFAEARQALAISGNWDAGVVGPELHAILSADLPEWLDTLNAPARAHLEEAKARPAGDYVRAKEALRAYAASADARLSEVDVLVCPTSPITPPTLREARDDAFTRKSGPLSARNTCIVNLLGLCALSLPVALDGAGMPVGLQLVARAHHEEALLATAQAFEDALGTGRRRLGTAPLCAN
jgi:aspartyl-tRNA(Asn)/glutamyl-tRNA(Gln) amidotransferase subunit A